MRSLTIGNQWFIALLKLLTYALLGWVDLGVLGKKCFDFFGLQETVSRNSYMTTGLYRYSLAQPAILPPAQHMRGTSKIGSFNLSISKIIFDK